MSNIRWGVISTAKIGIEKVIPAMQKAEHTEVAAIASQALPKAQEAAHKLGIAKAYGSYEALLADPDIDAIYNPLPNHLHVDWSIKALQAGKHVLCEKPVSNKAADIRRLISAQAGTNLVFGEAFMIKAAPQWRRVKTLIESGALGEITAVQGSFFYHNVDAQNIRNRVDAMGGAMLDIGCYPLTVARMVFDTEPDKVIAAMDMDPNFKTDRLTSAILQFGSRHCVFSVGTQTAGFQRVVILGSIGHLEIRIPFNAPNDRPTEVWQLDGDCLKDHANILRFDTSDQYAAQAEDFARAILDKRDALTTLHDSFGSAAAVEALFKSCQSGQWETPERLG